MHPLINIAVRAARRAGNILLRNLERIDELEITTKGKSDFVSEVDRLSEAAIIEEVQKNYPEHSILGEEGGRIEGNEFCWVLDPLDGTSNYLHNYPHFCVSIGIKFKQRLEHAVVYDPLREELFVASRGQGAMLNNRRIRVSKRYNLEQALIGVGFPPREADARGPYLGAHEALVSETALRRSGSAALDLAYVAAGRLDVFFEYGLKEWDMAAGALLVREAGGLVSAPDGGDDYLERGQIIAGTPRLFKTVIRTLHTVASSR